MLVAVGVTELGELEDVAATAVQHDLHVGSGHVLEAGQASEGTQRNGVAVGRIEVLDRGSVDRAEEPERPPLARLLSNGRGLGGWSAGRLRRKGEGTMDDRDLDAVRQFMADMPLTMEGHELSLFRDIESVDDPEVARVFEQRRWEVILKAVLVQLARAAGDKPMSVEMTYDPVASPHRPIYGPIYRPSRL